MSTNRLAALGRTRRAWHEAAPRRARFALLTMVLALALVNVTWGPSSATVGPQAVPTTGQPAVGALFTFTSSGGLGWHFCTASVVHSPANDLVLTAAHCLSGRRPSQVAFVPEYHDGMTPFGIWQVDSFFEDRAWQRLADPDDDYAFLTVSQPGSTEPVELLTGSEHLAGAIPSVTPRPLLRVVGYPDALDSPVRCASRLQRFSPTQLQFDCGGYTIGTSGSPFVVDIDRVRSVVGVIGGYEQGGYSPSVSYAARLGASARRLYRAATAA